MLRTSSNWEPPVNPPKPGTRVFLVGRPDFSHRSLTGRGTKGFIAFDPDTDTFVYLKDSWRSDYADPDGHVGSHAPRPEMVTYGELYAKEVRNVAHVRCGGDVYNDGDS